MSETTCHAMALNIKDEINTCGGQKEDALIPAPSFMKALSLQSDILIEEVRTQQSSGPI